VVLNGPRQAGGGWEGLQRHCSWACSLLLEDLAGRAIGDACNTFGAAQQVLLGVLAAWPCC